MSGTTQKPVVSNSFFMGFGNPPATQADLINGINTAQTAALDAKTAAEGAATTAATASTAALTAQGAAEGAQAAATSAQQAALGAMPKAGGTFTGAISGPSAKLGAQGWLEDETGLTESVSQACILSTQGRPALAVGTRVSDGGGGVGGQIAWALGSFVFNDLLVNPQGQDQRQTGYGHYIEAHRRGNAGSVEGIEITVFNTGNEVAISPYNIGSVGETLGILIGAGGASDGPSRTRMTAAMVFQGSTNPADKFFSGIVIGPDALAPHPAFGHQIAMDMTKDTFFVWRNATDEKPLSWIGNTSLQPGEGGILEFGRTGVTLRGNSLANGANSPGTGAGFFIDGTTNDLNLYGTARARNGLAVTGDAAFGGALALGGTLRWDLGYQSASGDNEAATKGVPTGTVYVNSATGALTLRRA